MLDTININKGKVTKMYRNKKKIWQMPRCSILSIGDLYRGSISIIIKTYPARANVKIIIGQRGEEDVFDFQTDALGEYRLSFDKELDSGYAEIEVSADGFLEENQYKRF